MEKQKSKQQKTKTIKKTSPLKPIFEEDPYLVPYAPIYEKIYSKEKKLLAQIEKAYKEGFDQFSRGYEYYGIFEDESHYTVREWLPDAKAAFFMGDFNFWNREEHPMSKNEYGVFILTLPKKQYKIAEMSYIKLHIHGHNGEKYDRNMAYARYCTQNKEDNSFCQRYIKIFRPKRLGLKRSFTDGSYFLKERTPPKKNVEKVTFSMTDLQPEQLLIYECHTGMSSEFGHVATYNYFTKYKLAYIKGQGYTAIQLMAIQEHAYYASFGYQVTNFFAPSSRFGTIDDLKNLIKKAHELGLKVIIDLVLSHASSNSNDGIGDMDGSGHQYFHGGDEGNHDVWGSKLFNYSKFEVLRFLCSNVRFWIEEFDVDGFRLDAVTSMLYKHHGVGVGFTGQYKEYFENDVLDLVRNKKIINN